MGSFISRFRKKPSTEDQLKKIEDGLRKIEDYKRSTERKHKKLVASIIIYSAALYILACVVVFVWYLPESWIIRLALLIPLVLVPVIVYLLKRLISKYFDSRMVKANEEYSDLQRKKKSIIDSVMETETFNKAKEILSKYAPENLDKKDQQQLVSRQPAVSKLATTPSDVRRRNTAQATARVKNSPETVTSLATLPRRDLSPLSSTQAGVTAIRQRLPQPMFPKERGVTDKLIEFMIGDGPGYRYALICNHCQGHNGMALKEEFPYMAFNCCYCYQYNPARSKRPVPPKLPVVNNSSATARTRPALPAPVQSRLLQPHTTIEDTKNKNGDDDKNGEGSENESTDEKSPEGGNDLNFSEETDKLNGEKSDDDFQKLGFSECDQELLSKMDPSASGQKEATHNGSSSTES